jgi:adenosylmethionine-8-amino-7-oxononanoate aminotransferase
MTDVLILGTDTNAGKTALALLWLAELADDYEYWKPLETGDSDSQRVRQCVPGACVHPPLAQFERVVAPFLAARLEGRAIPAARDLIAAKPSPSVPGRHLLIETFGSALSPLNETELQVMLVRALAVPVVLVSSSAVGAIGRTLQSLSALQQYGIRPSAVVLMGRPDAFAVEQLGRYWPQGAIFCLELPSAWDAPSVARAAQEQSGLLQALRSRIPGATKAPRERGTTDLGESPGVLASIPSLDVAEILERDRRFVWHPYTSLQDPDPPLVAVAAEDEFLNLADGRRVIDAISSWWTILHGHRNPALMAALHEAAESFDHVHFAGVTHPAAVDLAALLLSKAPWPGGRVFFSDNGSTAVEVALKMAYQYWCHQGEPQRTWFVGLEGGYHGDTFGAMSVSRDPLFFGRFEPLLFRAEMVPLSAERLDDALTRLAGKVAAVIVEPLVQGAGGMRMYSAQELGRLADVARQHGVLFIADEAMTGAWRTGWLWAHQAAEIAPDLICAAKTLAGGVLPLAATLAAPHLVAAWDTADRSRTFFHGHSFTAHPLACAVALANWKMLTEAPPSAPKRMECFWSDALAPLRGHPRVREIRVRGIIAAVELEVPGGYLAPVGRLVRSAGLQEGVLLRPLGSVLYALPPFCTSDASLEKIAQAMHYAIRALG